MTTSYTSRLGSAPEEGIKAPCKAASEINIVLSGEQDITTTSKFTGAPVVTPVVDGDRVLATAQTDPTENGIWICRVGAWERAPDANDSQDLLPGMLVGDTLGNLWMFEFTGDFDPGVTAITLNRWIGDASTDPTISRAYTTVSDMKAASISAGVLVRTKGYYAAGDGGHATYLIKTSSDYGTAPDEYGDHTLANGNVAVLQHDGAVNVKQFGAKGDGIADDTAALDAAMSASLSVYVPPGRYNISNSSPLKVRNFHAIYGPSAPSASTTGVTVGGAKFIMSGSAVNAFENSDPASPLLHASIENITMTFTGTYSWMFDFRGCIGCDFRNLDIETSSTTMSGFRTKKIDPGDSSWMNNTNNVRIRLPNSSSGRPWDVDAGDSAHMGDTFAGGLGAIDRATGGNKYIGCLLNNTNASGAGFTASIETESGWQSMIIGCEIEENAGADILIDGDADDTLSNTLIRFQIIGCHFRSSSAPSSIVLKNDTGNILKQGLITGCSFKASGANEITYDATRWEKITVTGNSYRLKNHDRINAGFEVNSNLTISSGAVTISGSRHEIGTETAAATDDLDTINGGQDGDLLILSTISDTRDVVVKDGVGNIQLSGGDFTLGNRKDKLLLFYNGATGNWEEISRSTN